MKLRGTLPAQLRRKTRLRGGISALHNPCFQPDFAASYKGEKAMWTSFDNSSPFSTRCQPNNPIPPARHLAMIVNVVVLVLAATILSSKSLVLALSASDVPTDTPISSLLASANAHLAKGETNDALTYYDVAISRDPNNYLTYFKRGATYLSLGRTLQATQDFDKVLVIKPGFEGALVQRAKIKAKNGEWDAAKKDFLMHGNSEADLAELEEAKGAAALATAAEKRGNWEECITQSGVAIMVASKLLSLRKTRAHCRFERGEVQEGMSDLKHVLQMQSGLTEPHMQISAITFFGLADLEHGMEQMRKCLHSDPESKNCKKLYRREKNLSKTWEYVNKHFEKHQYSSALKLLLPAGEDLGLVQDVKDDVKELRESGTIPEHSPNDLVARVVEMVCESYREVRAILEFCISHLLTIIDEKLQESHPVVRRSSYLQRTFSPRLTLES
jgi:DnaJ family protein C protein 3